MLLMILHLLSFRYWSRS